MQLLCTSLIQVLRTCFTVDSWGPPYVKNVLVRHHPPATKFWGARVAYRKGSGAPFPRVIFNDHQIQLQELTRQLEPSTCTAHIIRITVHSAFLTIKIQPIFLHPTKHTHRSEDHNMISLWMPVPHLDRFIVIRVMGQSQTTNLDWR